MFYMYVYANQVGVLKLYLPVMMSHILLPLFAVSCRMYIYMYLPGVAVMLDRWSNSPVTVSSPVNLFCEELLLVVYMYAILNEQTLRNKR